MNGAVYVFGGLALFGMALPVGGAIYQRVLARCAQRETRAAQ